ncbi:Hpt domain-containing protein [Pseudarthrobacter sp. N5]|uniref:Hpt domain-containing protein n=1 Tax=Pseudarthrobacter sp. N5 TaxID=3418416 RepID=UPI003CF4D63F
MSIPRPSPTPPDNSDELPLVDPDILQELEDEVDGPRVAHRFARDYTEMWVQRYRRLTAAVDRQDRADALDAIISLKTSSAMVGGLRLARLAEDLEQIIRRGDFSAGRALVTAVADHGGQTVKELQFLYVTTNE